MQRKSLMVLKLTIGTFGLIFLLPKDHIHQLLESTWVGTIKDLDLGVGIQIGEGLEVENHTEAHIEDLDQDRLTDDVKFHVAVEVNESLCSRTMVILRFGALIISLLNTIFERAISRYRLCSL